MTDMIAFATSLAADIMVAIDHEEPHRVEEDHPMLDIVIATAVLNSVEMQVIKSALYRAADRLSFVNKRMDRRKSLWDMGLPLSVIEWVLS